MDRKTFIKKTAGVLLLAAPAYALLSCSSSSDDSSSTPPPTGGDPDCLANGTNSSIGGNHGHSITVSSADVNAGSEKTYNIMGSSGHSHSVTVTSANFTTLKNNQQINITSTNNDEHTHSIAISCA